MIKWKDFNRLEPPKEINLLGYFINKDSIHDYKIATFFIDNKNRIFYDFPDSIIKYELTHWEHCNKPSDYKKYLKDKVKKELNIKE